jgi:hypothetical protein
MKTDSALSCDMFIAIYLCFQGLGLLPHYSFYIVFLPCHIAFDLSVYFGLVYLYSFCAIFVSLRFFLTDIGAKPAH